MIRLLRLGHRQIGLVAMWLVLFTAATGWALMHPDWWTGQDFRLVAASSEVVLAGGASGLFRSEDGGKAWQEVTMAVPTRHVTALTRGKAGFAVAFRDMGIWQSPDGFVWERIPGPEGEQVQAISEENGQWVILTDKALYHQKARQPIQPSMLKRLHDWHTGWAWGGLGTRLVEAGAIALFFLSFSGLVMAAWTFRKPSPPDA